MEFKINVSEAEIEAAAKIIADAIIRAVSGDKPGAVTKDDGEDPGDEIPTIEQIKDLAATKPADKVEKLLDDFRTRAISDLPKHLRIAFYAELEEMGEQEPVQQAAYVIAPVVPTAVQSYSMDQLAVAATQLVDAGRRQELISLLTSFGVQALTALPKDQYGNFAAQLRAMGAKI